MKKLIKKLILALMRFHRDLVLPTIGASCVDVRADR